MKNLNGKRFAWAIFIVFAACFGIVAFTQDLPVNGLCSALKIGCKALPMVIVIAGLFVRFAWRWRIFSGWLVPFPDLNGSWKGGIQTTWKNPETGEIPGPIPTILTIKQSFFRISCVMRTGEMISRSYLADFWMNDDEQIQRLGYSYDSKPNLTVADRSKPHEGTVVFELIGKPVKKLKGNYWTTRQTTGAIELAFGSKKHMDEVPSQLGAHPVSKNDN